MKQILQSLYDECNWTGYAERNGKRYYKFQILKIAARMNIQLTYNCPA